MGRSALSKLAEAKVLLADAAIFAKTAALAGPAFALKELAARKIAQAVRQMRRRPKKR